MFNKEFGETKRFQDSSRLRLQYVSVVLGKCRWWWCPTRLSSSSDVRCWSLITGDYSTFRSTIREEGTIERTDHRTWKK
jgi:hypothetical protein